MNINHVTLVGRLTRDPKVKELENDNAVANFGIAVNRNFGGKDKKEETTFVDCVAWGNTAKIIERFCHKGDLLGVSGRLQLDSWQDKETKEDRSRLIVVAENVSLGPKSQSNGDDESEGGSSFNYGANKKSDKKPAAKGKTFKPKVAEPEEEEETQEEEVAARPPVKRPF